VNIDVKIVRIVGICDDAVPVTPAWPSQTTPPLTKSHWLPGWVSSNGIAP
jgi:hypothetical protein